MVTLPSVVVLVRTVVVVVVVIEGLEEEEVWVVRPGHGTRESFGKGPAGEMWVLGLGYRRRK